MDAIGVQVDGVSKRFAHRVMHRDDIVLALIDPVTSLRLDTNRMVQKQKWR